MATEMDLNDSEIATIIDALIIYEWHTRMFNRSGEAIFDDAAPLTNKEIDELIERLQEF